MAGTQLDADAPALGHLPDMLPHFIIFPLCCQATHLLPNSHGFCCPLANSNTWILGPQGDCLYPHLDCIGICDDWFQQQDGIESHFGFSMVVTDWVVDLKCPVP